MFEPPVSKSVSSNPQRKKIRKGEVAGGSGPANQEKTASSARSRAIFGIDPRSLAVFRIGLGVLILADLAIRATDLRAMYTDEGMFSRMEMSYRYTSIWNWSFHFANGGVGFQAVLFVLAVVLGLGLLLGMETRLATIGSWLMLISIQHRVPPILSGADILLRMLLFWAMFLPLGGKWSLDRWLERKRGRVQGLDAGQRVVSIASAAILLQMGMMYFFSAIFKSNSDWLKGEVIAGTLAHDFYAKPLGTFFLQYPTVLMVLTWGVFLLEWVGPLMLFSPWRNGAMRLAAVAGLAGMHVAIALTVEVDLFSPVALAGLALFLPREFWENGWFARFHQPVEEGVSTSAPVYRKAQRGPWHYAAQGACLVVLLYVVAINIQTLGKEPPPKASLMRAGLGLAQEWNMFDETPSKDGWYVARAILKDGSEVDLLTEGEVEWTRPAVPAQVYPNHRWRKVFREMSYEDILGFQVFRRPAAEYLVREWNAEHPEEKQIKEFEFIFCTETPSQSGEEGRGLILREPLLQLDLSEP